MESEATEEGSRPAYIDVCIAGGLGGSTADFMMHSVDTVKTRLQGQPTPYNLAPKYTSMLQTFRTILQEEGVRSGLYGGVTPAILGSLPSTVIYFGTYEYTKRNLTDAGSPEVLAHLAAGSMGDLAASVVYVPSEVLKTRMQLQGRYNNPHFMSGYNYQGTWHAIKMAKGWASLYHGYLATLVRDVPFSALQFAFYEQFKKLAIRRHTDADQPLTLVEEIITGSMAGGIAGAITTPLDVVKTLLQTQKRKPLSTHEDFTLSRHPSFMSLPPSKLPTGIISGLINNFKQQGLSGLFRGLGPRVSWTSLQSAIMFMIYEQVLELEKRLRIEGVITW
ncbi:hypothetical protein BZG36_03776 [Bifiguratus adelaidae]|uniref:Mitochondrial thiamine pyrophosphate carrier 1 n=1 Tax=Bifiguratus adelaidae TaxID=1938954 RepID=A0A261XXH9_9FUNG|nr:hypothetical protein BZG36_03776 [Bifiguratus adelaidae]